jgi:hypothetical protein
MRVTLPMMLACAVSGAAFAAKPARVADPELVVVTSGSEQALKLGETTLSRPFGAQLVDSLTIVGRYGSPIERFYLIEGAAGAACPARYVVVSAKRRQPPLVSSPLGGCGRNAQARLAGAGLMVTVSPGPDGMGAARYQYERGAVRSLDAPSPLANAQPAAPRFRCHNPSDLAALDGNVLEAELDRTLPADYRASRGLKRAEIDPRDLHQMVAGLACLATMPGGVNRISDAATPLFASRRYGDAAFASLDRLAGASNSDVGLRASARLFSAEMKYRVRRREPL